MNLPYFIAQRLIKGRKEETSFSRPINVIAIIGIAMGLAVMILAVSTLTGFKKAIREKVVGFGANIQIMHFDSNLSFETIPVSDTQQFIHCSKCGRKAGSAAADCGVLLSSAGIGSSRMPCCRS